MQRSAKRAPSGVGRCVGCLDTRPWSYSCHSPLLPDWVAVVYEWDMGEDMDAGQNYQNGISDFKRSVK